MKIEKGQPGYVKSRKTKYLLWAVIEFAVVVALVVIGVVQSGSRMNLLTVVAVVGCLPAAKMLAEYITMAPYNSIAQDKYDEIEEKAPLLTKVYDLVITSPQKVMQVDAIVISGHTVCGYTSNEKTDEVKTACYIKEMLRKYKYDKITVKIFHDYVAFLSRAEGMNSIAAIEQPDNRRREKRIRHLLMLTSM
ncbi:MAG: hypothetical protein Q4F98_00820 [Lachnospiraceae bacterium]|nr:hypothetical protein [Lachnospiraceae bacterium]